MSHAPIGELDHGMHKSNSTYLTNLDIASSHHHYCPFREGVNKYSSGTERKNGTFFPALEAVTISFKREINPYKKYEIWTRVLPWDKKWVYMVSHFVEAGKVKPHSFSDQP
jgi:Thioesterase-like superfamily